MLVGPADLGFVKQNASERVRGGFARMKAKLLIQRLDIFMLDDAEIFWHDSLHDRPDQNIADNAAAASNVG